ncbi:MAG: T9SS type A sorting domain-containing protein [Bacteroidetes bacterium]|nr:T9SS type A sorting domain-containing protein [Bacteroidota bacterium]
MKTIYTLIFVLLFALFSCPVFSQDWNEQTSGTTENLNGIWFTDIFNGWAVGDAGKIIHIGDGGFHWSAQTSGVTVMINGVQFANETTGWAVGDDGKILFTSDGGQTWSLQTSNTTEDLNCLSFIDDQIGWIGGDGNVILFTNDGGTTWVSKASGFYPNANGIFFLDSQHGWITGNNGITISTTDGGDSWSLHPGGVAYSLEDVWFADTQNGFAVGVNGSLIRSADGGTNWQTIDLGINEAFLSIFFTDTLNGWICGTAGTLLNTTDGGQTWSEVTLTLNDNLRWIHFANRYMGWISGNNGTVLKTIPQQEICMVTVDSMSLWNMIVWEKVEDIGAMYYVIYKKTGGNYDSIGVKYYDEMSEFIDYASTPDVHSDFYKISVVDSAGNEHPKSPYHKTINLSIVQGVPNTTMTLIFDEYEDESGNFQPTQYLIYRGTSLADLTLLASVPIGILTYDDPGVYDVFTYRVIIDLAGECIPTSIDKAQGGPYSHSYSNLEDNAIIIDDGIAGIEFSHDITIRPNPFSQRTTIKFSNSHNTRYYLTVTDITGQVVFLDNNIREDHFILEKGNLTPGYYFVELRGNRIYRERVIVR